MQQGCTLTQEQADAHKSLYKMHTIKLLWHMRHTPECVYLKARSVSAYHFINLGTVVLLNVPQYPDVVTLHKVDSNTLQNDTLQCQQYNSDTPDQGTNRGAVGVLQLCTLRPYLPDLPILWMYNSRLLGKS